MDHPPRHGGWDGSSFIIVTTRAVTTECVTASAIQLRKQSKLVLHLDADAKLIVEETVTFRRAPPPALLAGGRVISGDEPQVVWVSQYERVGSPRLTQGPIR